MGAGASHAQASSQHSSQHGGAQASAYDAGSYAGSYGQAGAYKDAGYGQVGAAKYNNGPAAAAMGPGSGTSAPGHAAAPQQQALPQASSRPACMRLCSLCLCSWHCCGVEVLVGAVQQGLAACSLHLNACGMCCAAWALTAGAGSIVYWVLCHGCALSTGSCAIAVHRGRPHELGVWFRRPDRHRMRDGSAQPQAHARMSGSACCASTVGQQCFA